MGPEHRFDIVSKVNLQELRNAVMQAQKEISTRFDFKDSSASVAFEEAALTIRVAADHRAQLHSVVEVLQAKLAKRGVSLQAVAWKDAEQLLSGGMKRQAAVQQGLSAEKAKEIVQLINALHLKVQPRIEGETVRVSGKQIDDLQQVIQALRAKEVGVPVQVENYR